MAFLVGGANSAVSGYDIENSLRLNSGDSPNLSWTPSSSGNQTICTFSCWVKRSLLGSHLQPIWSTKVSTAGTNAVVFMPGNGANDKMHLVVAGTDDSNFGQTTSNTFRDVSAWYHLVARIDTTQGTAANRIRAYVNGESVTLSGTPGYPDEDETCRLSNNDRPQTIGEDERDNIHFDGYVSEVAFIDGASLAPTSFAETDEDSGIWKPKDFKDDVTFGTNGYYLEFKETGTSQNSSGIGADTSGNDNHFAVTNLAATDITTDTPTNNFANLIPALNMTLSEGNVKAMTTRTGNWDAVHSSIGVTSGKWYFEVKASRTEDNFRVVGGVAGNPENFTILFNGQGASGDPMSTYSNTYPFYGKGVWLTHWYDHDYDDQSTASSQSSGDILQFALDMDNYKFWVGVNGQFKDNSNNDVSYSDVASGTSPTVTIPSGAYTGKTFFPSIQLRDDQDADDNVAEINFGNPSFSISSGNADANGYGNFEYAVPSGFYALSTKNLAEFG